MGSGAQSVLDDRRRRQRGAAAAVLIRRLISWARRLKRDGFTLALALRDPRTPWRAKALTIAAAAYAISPIDLIPDFILALGFVDDAVVVSGLMWLALRALPPAVLADCRARVDKRLAGPRAAKRGGLIALIVLWLALAGLLAWWIFG